MGYPILRRNMRSLVRDALLDDDLSREWGRKSGATLGEEGATVVPTGSIWGTFSRRNDPQGFVEQHSHQELAFFPNDERGMDRYADWSGISQVRLLVTVTKAGRAGSKMTIVGDGISFAGGLSVPLDSLGEQISLWKDVSLSDGPEALTRWIVENPNPGGGGTPGGDPPGGLEFMRAEPGNLTVEGTSYFADWCAWPPHVGYTQSQASTLIHTYLDDPTGWAAAGITFREVSEADARVKIRIVEEATCNVPESACTHYYGTSPPTAYIELEYEPLQSSPNGPGNLVNHEAGHAFFYAAHGGDIGGIMNIADVVHPEKPSASDIASVETWLGTPGDTGVGTFAVGLCQLQGQ